MAISMVDFSLFLSSAKEQEDPQMTSVQVRELPADVAVHADSIRGKLLAAGIRPLTNESVEEDMAAQVLANPPSFWWRFWHLEINGQPLCYWFEKNVFRVMAPVMIAGSIAVLVGSLGGLYDLIFSDRLTPNWLSWTLGAGIVTVLGAFALDFPLERGFSVRGPATWEHTPLEIFCGAIPRHAREAIAKVKDVLPDRQIHIAILEQDRKLIDPFAYVKDENDDPVYFAQWGEEDFTN